MLLVPTELRPSSIHGIGVFLLEAVKKGDLVWRFDSRIDRVYSNRELESLPPVMQEFLKKYAYWYEAGELWVMCGDNARHFNHADNPNTEGLDEAFAEDVAAHDLPAGTELTADYTTYCDRDKHVFKKGGG